MLIIDFKKTTKESFRNGFAKGVCAPLMLFGSFDVQPPRRIDYIELPTISTKDALKNDWIAIGNDFNKVIELHDKKIKHST